MRHVLSLDATALQALETIYSRTKPERITLILSGVRAQPLIVLERSGLLDKMGGDNSTPTSMMPSTVPEPCLVSPWERGPNLSCQP
jgi:anti-anti-sigma regulatory factor